MPFKCFNCGKDGHFQAKCPYPKKYSEDEDDINKQYKKKGKFHYKKKNYKEKKNFYSKEEDKSSSAFTDSDDEVLSLCIEESNQLEEIEHKEESQDDAEVNMEEEILSALDELRKYKNRYRQLKSFVVEQKEEYEQKEREMEKVISNLKNQIVDAKSMEESLKKTLKEKQLTYERMEA